ncbi:MAG: hypothetical protein ACRC50_13065 [Gaiella sp.]
MSEPTTAMVSDPAAAETTSASSLALRFENAAGLAGMRGWLRAWLSEIDAEPRRAREIVLACSEAATDLIRTSRPGSAVELDAAWVDGHVLVRVAVRSGRPGWQALRRPDPLGARLLAASLDHVIVLSTDTGRRYLMCRCLGQQCTSPA